MKRSLHSITSVRLAIGCLVASVAACTSDGAGQAAQTKEKPLELACLDRFDIDRFEIGCWAWPIGRPYDDAYIGQMARDGFTAFVGGQGDLHFQNYLMKVTGPVLQGAPFDLDLLDKYNLRYMFGCYHTRAPRLLELHEKHGRGRRIMGYQLNDNCDLHPYTYTSTALLAKVAPEKIPWTSYNPNPIPQSRTGLPIISSQNYPFTWHAADPEEQIRQEFCNICENDRFIANGYDMAPWPVVVLCSAPSQYRFQVNTAVAYGAQSVWFFNYSPLMTVAWGRTFEPTHRYLTRVAGPHLLGHRSAGVLHTGPEIPSGHDRPGVGKIVESMDEYLLAGALVTDADFKAGRIAPDLLYVVDKRTEKFAETNRLRKEGYGIEDSLESPPEAVRKSIEEMYRQDPSPRSARITLGGTVRSAAALLSDGTVRTYNLKDGREIELPPLRGGEGVLLRINSDPVRVIRVPDDTRVEELATRWKFRLDPDGLAEEEEWHQPAFDDAAWPTLRVPAYCGWKFQQYPFPDRVRECGIFIGNGWYRLRRAAPPALLKKHMYLHFGAADEQAWVYADGKLILEHTSQATGYSAGQLWKMPFLVEVTEIFKDGKEHTLAVRVQNQGGSGGLYEPAYLIASDEALGAEQLNRIAFEKTKQNEWLRE